MSPWQSGLVTGAPVFALVIGHDRVSGTHRLVAVAPTTSSFLLVLAVPAALAEVAVYRAGIRVPPWRNITTAPAFYGVAAVLAVGAAAGALGRTGGLLCRPESLAQGHAIFHLAMAVALGAWAAWTVLGTVALREVPR